MSVPRPPVSKSPFVIALLVVGAASCGRGILASAPGDGGGGGSGTGTGGVIGGRGGAGGGGAMAGSGGAVADGGAAAGTGGVTAGGGASGGAGMPGGRGGAGGGGATAGNGGAAGGFPPGCHYDCFGRTTCVDGVVTWWANTPIDCRHWTGSCPSSVVATCRKGCAAAVIHSSVPMACPLVICRENTAKVAGDPCQADDDCRPIPAGSATDTPANIYLRCDVAAGRCVAASPPVVADWMAACTPSLLTSFMGQTTGVQWFDDPRCSSGACVAAGTQTCVRQGCTTRCRSDDECPMGSRCINSCDPFDVERRGVCVPPSAALPCLPAATGP
jgi:hypothetical protein